MWVQIGIWIGLTVLSAILSHKSTKDPQDPTPGELTATTVDASSPIPVLFGTRKLTAANCVWWGDVGTTPIKTKSGGKK